MLVRNRQGLGGRGPGIAVKPGLLPHQLFGDNRLFFNFFNSRDFKNSIMASENSSSNQGSNGEKFDPKEWKSRGLRGQDAQTCCEKICEAAYRAGVRDGVAATSSVWRTVYESYSFLALTPLQRFIFGANDPDQVQSLVARLPGTSIQAPVTVRPAFGMGFSEAITIQPRAQLPAPTVETLEPGSPGEGKLPVSLPDGETLTIGYSDFYDPATIFGLESFFPVPLPLPQVAEKVSIRVRTALRNKYPCRKECKNCNEPKQIGRAHV